MRIAIYITSLLLAAGCASNDSRREVNYCAWSQDSSRWTANEPDWKNAFIASAMGLNERASQAVLGGFLKRDRVYDNQGHMMEVVSNDRGIVHVEDFTAGGCYLTPKAHYERQVGVFSYRDLVQMKIIK